MSEKKQVYVAVDKKDKLFYYDGEKYTPVLDETGGGGEVKLKTINGEDLHGEGNIAITTYQAFPASWPTDNQHTTKQFCNAIDADASAVIGMGYFGGARWSDKPQGLANFDIVVEILEGPNSTKAIHLIGTSSTVYPYRWEYTYWSHGSVSGWRGVQPELISGTNIKTVNNQSLLGEGNIEIEGGDAAFKQDVYQPMFEPEGFPCFIFAAPIQDETMFLEVVEGSDTEAWMRVLDYVLETDEHNITDNFGLVWNIIAIREDFEFEGEARVDVTTNTGLQRMFCHFHIEIDAETGDSVVVIDEHNCDNYMLENSLNPEFFQEIYQPLSVEPNFRYSTPITNEQSFTDACEEIDAEVWESLSGVEEPIVLIDNYGKTWYIEPGENKCFINMEYTDGFSIYDITADISIETDTEEPQLVINITNSSPLVMGTPEIPEEAPIFPLETVVINREYYETTSRTIVPYDLLQIWDHMMNNAGEIDTTQLNKTYTAYLTQNDLRDFFTTVPAEWIENCLFAHAVDYDSTFPVDQNYLDYVYITINGNGFIAVAETEAKINGGVIAIETDTEDPQVVLRNLNKALYKVELAFFHFEEPLPLPSVFADINDEELVGPHE